MKLTRRALTLGAISAAAIGVTAAQAEDIKLPGTLVISAYDVGSSGYSQMVGLGSILKNNHGTNVRVLPGKNDVSRLGPVKNGRRSSAGRPWKPARWTVTRAVTSTPGSAWSR